MMRATVMTLIITTKEWVLACTDKLEHCEAVA